MNEITLPGAPASQGALIEQTRAAAEVAAAVSVARQFPRDVAAATDEMRRLCSNPSVAARAFYEVPNRGAGLSVHIARELARVWSNVDYGVRELRRDDAAGESEMSVWCWDQQTNVRSTRSFIQPHARMRGRQRQQLTDLGDIYLANQNTGARAVRECIFTMLPGAFVAEAEQLLRRTLESGGGVSLEQRIEQAVARFAELHITASQLVTRVGRPIADWTPGDVGTLARIHSTITIDGIPAAEFFPEQAVQIGDEGATS